MQIVIYLILSSRSSLCKCLQYIHGLLMDVFVRVRVLHSNYLREAMIQTVYWKCTKSKGKKQIIAKIAAESARLHPKKLWGWNNLQEEFKSQLTEFVCIPGSNIKAEGFWACGSEVTFIEIARSRRWPRRSAQLSAGRMLGHLAVQVFFFPLFKGGLDVPTSTMPSARSATWLSMFFSIASSPSLR